jgi:hypothetical protein
MKLAVVQSNYIPWPGYFQIILNADLVCFYDDVQYTKNDWRNRNLVINSAGPLWLTVPVHGTTKRNIDKIEIDNSRNWQYKHLSSIHHCYSHAPQFTRVANFLEFAYKSNSWRYLSELNQATIRYICEEYFGIKKNFVTSIGIATEKRTLHRLIEIVKFFNADTYLTGPGIFNYCSGTEFEDHDIELKIATFKDPSFYSNQGDSLTGVSIVESMSKESDSFKRRILNIENFQSWRDYQNIRGREC